MKQIYRTAQNGRKAIATAVLCLDDSAAELEAIALGLREYGGDHEKCDRTARDCIEMVRAIRDLQACGCRVTSALEVLKGECVAHEEARAQKRVIT